MTASVGATTLQSYNGGIAAGTQTLTSGTVVFSNSNNISFGMSGSATITASAYQFAFNAASATATSSFTSSATATGSAYMVSSVTIKPGNSNDSIFLDARLVLIAGTGTVTVNWWRINANGQTVVGFPFILGVSSYKGTYPVAAGVIDAPAVSTAITYNLYANVNTSANTCSVSGYQLIASEVP
jgi:hypothetical protein